jgi:hypothetical protein
MLIFDREIAVQQKNNGGENVTLLVFSLFAT